MSLATRWAVPAFFGIWLWGGSIVSQAGQIYLGGTYGSITANADLENSYGVYSTPTVGTSGQDPINLPPTDIMDTGLTHNHIGTLSGTVSAYGSNGSVVGGDTDFTLSETSAIGYNTVLTANVSNLVGIIHNGYSALYLSAGFTIQGHIAAADTASVEIIASYYNVFTSISFLCNAQ